MTPTTTTKTKKLPKLTKAERLALLQKHVEIAGSVVSFARDVVIRERRTVHRWLDGDKIPNVVVDWMQRNPNGRAA